MSQVPAQLRYSPTHEWVAQLTPGRYRVGITDHAQELLGDVVFVELPQTGQAVQAEAACGVIESVKAASDLYSPLSGEVVASNAELTDNPQWLNEDPYDKGWIFEIQADEKDFAQLLDVAAYQNSIGE
ncbi:glycine cleavage system protein GcvH [Acidithiobacillus sp. CV18-2]|uniref:Glycine cleavage system H protein n=1 Tax=Igneacidithiobacillus copahuensis TaxID=2724909 RepID=A0AAE2YP39_9PROT|nr:glycine cleavage system protein GcvH [Igneacidithiobacillus copahuensis]MBU2754342.1 glycine cleavage system protein GcvH [Acidithiobacillus sp. CV18-3]MBU2757635.1 glycine cleavage system protein GcvH [Acidithiobacillus sp. BN09-2]MBU2777050.1 glycine cleavage system protein GcvH [Acidithiobacillus sp. CV18-2]MBU2797362.1 glycine cleavage system protein GcvH [Acidithiobacillus sp. VAN18-2]MBU2799799.1 glycine cleavage system protein GcvH [Acidithiobacillus sp. VAN18-4]UTV81965.1 glycine c